MTETDLRHKSLEMIRDEGRWPCWPLLPLRNLKRNDGTGFPELGVLVSGKPFGLKNFEVYLTNMLFLESEKDLAGVPRAEYASAREMLDDGWVVD